MRQVLRINRKSAKVEDQNVEVQIVEVQIVEVPVVEENLCASSRINCELRQRLMSLFIRVLRTTELESME